MMMNPDQAIAKSLLLNRADGFSVLRFIRQSARRYLVSTVVALALLAGVVYQGEMPMRLFFMLGFGMYCGALVRDIGWLRRMKKDWECTSRIIDWKKVESMAEERDSANQVSKDMRKRLTILIAVLVAAAGLLLYAMNVARLYAVHDDACRVIAAELANRPADRGALPDREIQALITNLIIASVIHGRVDANGVPSDLNGHPFIIRREPKQVSVATEWSLWQPFGIKHVVEVESRDSRTATPSVDDERRSGATSIQVVKTWQDLLNQPAIRAGQGTARLGVEARSAPCMSGILLYCVTEGYSLPRERQERNRLGPFRIEVRHENDTDEKAQEAGKMAWNDPPDISHSTALFRKSIPLYRSGKCQVRVLSLNGDLVAETEVTTTREACHPWMPLEPSPLQEFDHGKYDAVARVKNRAKGIAIPRFDGMVPMLFRSDGPDTTIRRLADERLPALLPEVAGDGLTVKASGTDLIIESKADIILARPDWHFLVRWWVNDKPYIPGPLDQFNDANGKVIIGKSLLLHLDFDPRWLGVASGDTVDLQLLYCKRGWELLEPGTQMLSAHLDAAGPELLLSNRTHIAWEQGRKLPTSKGLDK